jgi:hypothetical protein
MQCRLLSSHLPGVRRVNRQWAALALLTAVAAAIRLCGLGAPSLSEDEGFTAYAARLPLADMVQWCAADDASPLYYALLHFWIPLCPGEFGLRLPSVLFGVLAIPLLYLCGHAAHGGRAGMLAALCLTVNPLHVRYSQEARSGTLYIAAALLVLYFIMALVKSRAWGRWIGALAALTILGACVAPALSPRRHRKLEIRGALHYVLRNARRGDAIACVSPRIHPAVEYYLLGHDHPLFPQDLSELVQPDPPASRLDGLPPEEPTGAFRYVSSLWVLEIDDRQTQSMNRAARAWLSESMEPIDEQSFPGLRVLRYVPGARPPTPDAAPIPAGTTLTRAGTSDSPPPRRTS